MFSRLISVALLAVLVILLFAGCDASPHSSTAVAAPASSSSIVGSPSLSVDFINQVLSTYHSPAAGKGQALYDEGVKVGIDPAYALAFFLHESSFGTAGEARSSLSLGNLRCLDSVPCRDGYAWFSSWEAGFHAWYVLLAGPLYLGDHLTTLPQIIHRYAPAADSNDEQAYVQAVVHAVATWRSGQVEVH